MVAAELLERWIGPLKRRVSVMIGKALLSAVDDTNKLQVCQIDLMSEEIKTGVERIQESGFTSVPLVDAEAVAVCIGGNRDNMVIIATDSAATRPTGLEPGEACIYNAKNPDTKILLKENEIIIYSDKVTMETDELEVKGDINASGDISGAEVKLNIVGTRLSSHVHATAPTGPVSPPTPGT